MWFLAGPSRRRSRMLQPMMTSNRSDKKLYVSVKQMLKVKEGR